MSATSHGGPDRTDLGRLLPDDEGQRSALIAPAITPELLEDSQVSKRELRDLALKYVTSVLPTGTDETVTDFARTCRDCGLNEGTLATFLTDLQAWVLEAADREGPVPQERVQRATGQDIARISAAFVGARDGSGKIASETADAIYSQAEQVADRSAEIASLADQQSGNMDELSREVGDVSAAVEEIAASTDEVNAESDDAAALAEEGCQRARELSERIDAIHTRATRVNEAVEVLADHVADIEEFVETIDDIADQTNMLALNASIEAARVDGGEGFAVVADEVKSLAEDSQDEAARIRKLVTTIDEATTRVTDDIEDVYDEAEAGRVETDRAVETFESIEDITARLSASMDQVATATDQQAESTEELAMMADEANRKAGMILDEVTEINDSNRSLLETLENSLGTNTPG
ncbi:methyl-accepting chemotaxis protein [Salinibaculum sp. GCM10025337]|uniref:methyl-accepting chemotaxis protein n=2 Tax=Salinibaculum TaxID=2732368 RepID=UPI003614C4F5